MKSLVLFTIAMVAWVSYEASATESSCVLGSKGSIFMPHQHHALIGHSFLNQPGTVRIKCIMLCFRHSRCLSCNHDDTSGICQLNDASKEEFPESYKQDGSFSYFEGLHKAKPLYEETTMSATTEEETSQAQTTTKQATTVSTELLTTSANGVPLGMENGAITDSQITANDVKDDDEANYGPKLARLNNERSWCGTWPRTSWIQVEFSNVVDICSLIVQGREETVQRVGSLKLSYSNDGNNWTYMKDADQSEKVYLSGTSTADRDVFVSVQTAAQSMIQTKFIRIHPWLSLGMGTGACMRFELLGCN